MVDIQGKFVLKRQKSKSKYAQKQAPEQKKDKRVGEVARGEELGYVSKKQKSMIDRGRMQAIDDKINCGQKSCMLCACYASEVSPK